MIKDLKDWQKHAEKQNRKKHQWGWFQHNAGDVEYNTAFFNHVSGADDGDTSVLAGSIGDGGMGEGLVEDSMENEYILYYDDIDVEGEYGPMDWETGRCTKEYHSTTDYELKLDRDDLFNDLYELYQDNEASSDMTEEEIESYVSEHFDELFNKYYEKLKEKYRSWAQENANDEYEYDEDAGLDDYYDMLYSDDFDINEALNCIDKATCNRYDLRNLYECQRWSKENKKHLQEMLKKKVAPSTLYTYLAEGSLSNADWYKNADVDDWRVGQTIFADDGYDYKIVNTLDVKDVDGYELAVVALMPEDIGNPRIDDPDFQYAVMLDDNLEWGLCDTYDEAKEWYDGVNDGYYQDGSEYDDDIDWESHWEGELMDVDDDHFDDGHYNSEDDTFGESLKEDTVKQGKHWVNRGKAGTHGKFATKKAADAQRKAMFANGYKGESLEEDDSGAYYVIWNAYRHGYFAGHQGRRIFWTANKEDAVVYDTRSEARKSMRYLRDDIEEVTGRPAYYDELTVRIYRPKSKDKSVTEGKVKDLNIEINDDGSYEEWLDKAEYRLYELAQELRYLKHPARRKEINAGGDDTLEELQERIAAASKEYDELRKQYNVVLAEYEKHI